MQRALTLIERMANWKGIIALLVLYVGVFGAIQVTLGQLADASGGYGILDFDRGYSPERVDEVLGSYGEHGMALYARIQFLDLFNPALYSLLFACLTYLLWKRRGPHWLAFLPLLAGLGDYMENATLFLLARAYPDVPTSLVTTSSALSRVKNGFLALALLSLLAGLAFWVFSLIRSNTP